MNWTPKVCATLPMQLRDCLTRSENFQIKTPNSLYPSNQNTMKKSTPYRKALKTAKKLSKASFLGDYCKLADKVCASIVKSMGSIGHDIIDQSGTGEQGK